MRPIPGALLTIASLHGGLSGSYGDNNRNESTTQCMNSSFRHIALIKEVDIAINTTQTQQSRYAAGRNNLKTRRNAMTLKQMIAATAVAAGVLGMPAESVLLADCTEMTGSGFALSNYAIGDNCGFLGLGVCYAADCQTSYQCSPPSQQSSSVCCNYLSNVCSCSDHC